MTEVEVYLDWHGARRQIGLLRRHHGRGRERVSFTYTQEWIDAPDRFSIDPALPVGRNVFTPPKNREMFATLGDSAPDTWGRNLMRRRERRLAEQEGRAPRTLHETDFLLGVSDETRLGALRSRRAGDTEFQAPQSVGVPGTLALGRLLAASDRVVENQETDADLALIFAPGSSLGGARPKASIYDQNGNLSIAKFPKAGDEYSIERWEAIAGDMAADAGVRTAQGALADVGGRPVFLSRRFDRDGGWRIPFISAMALTEHTDGETGSYLELVDAITEHGSDAKRDRMELFRRVAFTVMVSNVDDHLRNHGFLWMGTRGWALSPAYDVNPTPVDVKPRILATNIDFDEATCSLDLLRSVTEEFALSLKAGDAIVAEVAGVVRQWRAYARGRAAPEAEIRRMASAFEHADLEAALTLG